MSYGRGRSRSRSRSRSAERRGGARRTSRSPERSGRYSEHRREEPQIWLTPSALAKLMQETAASAAAAAVAEVLRHQAPSAAPGVSPLALPAVAPTPQLTPARAPSFVLSGSPGFVSPPQAAVAVIAERPRVLTDTDIAAQFTQMKTASAEAQARFLTGLPDLYPKLEGLVRELKFEHKSLLDVLYMLSRIFKEPIDQNQGKTENIPELDKWLKLLLPAIEAHIKDFNAKDMALFCHTLHKLRISEAAIKATMQDPMLSRMPSILNSFDLYDLHVVIFFLHKMKINHVKLGEPLIQSIVNAYASQLRTFNLQGASPSMGSDLIRVLPMLIELGFGPNLPPIFCETYAAALNKLDLSNLPVDCYLECLAALFHLQMDSSEASILTAKLGQFICAKPCSIDYWKKFDLAKLRSFCLSLEFYGLKVPEELKTVLIQNQNKTEPVNWFLRQPMIGLIKKIFGGTELYRTDVGVVYDLGLIEQNAVIRFVDDTKLPEPSSLDAIQDKILLRKGIKVLKLSFKAFYREMAHLPAIEQLSYLEAKLKSLGLVPKAQASAQAASRAIYDPAMPFGSQDSRALSLSSSAAYP